MLSTESTLTCEDALRYAQQVEVDRHGRYHVIGRYWVVVSRHALQHAQSNLVRDMNAMMRHRAQAEQRTLWPLHTIVLKGGDVLMIRFWRWSR